MITPHPILAANLTFVIERAPIEGKVILCTLAIFSIFAWSVLISKALQMRRASKLNELFDA
ncbi:MAG: Biopolymer transporter ExbB, partial [Verrucomicrobiales bacterium]|nr:Biopolymer transporter ExbB [Verrucomicrobiales bacterium]